ncbi:Lrp/AsnC ligand binding domain-containing protein [Streptomyces sp. MK37H]|uniref:Lrp/AsnC ligand binding domain-containing protein n=1 Tax=Streptomyces sp. MK37H TaxID=2699117 RepID=UPI001B35EDF4|nr:Lrp/AsnC ligand binding domain-containing protein [Streptomyces sp. MK37H]MBP8533263.1 hypothetical protein [Streptomyces sp. MK37H]
MKIADFTALKEPLPHWRDHLALWAASRQPGSLPLDRCVIDLRAPELEPARLVDRTGLAQIAGLAPDDLPHPRYGRRSLPVPQTETAEGPRWSRPVARDWAEEGSQADWQEVRRAVSTVAEIEYAWLVAGSADMVVLMRLRDTRHLRDVILSRIQSLPGVARTETLLVIDEVAHRPAVLPPPGR